MESCACQLNFDTNMSGLAYVPKEQGILLTVRKNPGLQPDTASYLYRVLKCINLTFGYPKDSGSGAQHKNPRPNLEAVTKTDSNNVFGLKL